MTALCTHATSKTPTATGGRSCGWTRRWPRAARPRSDALLRDYFASAVPEHRCLVDDAAGTVHAVAYFQPKPAGDRLWDLTMIAVDPTLKRGGLGKALMAVVEEELRESGQRLLVVETSPTGSFEAPVTISAAWREPREGRRPGRNGSTSPPKKHDRADAFSREALVACGDLGDTASASPKARCRTKWVVRFEPGGIVLRTEKIGCAGDCVGGGGTPGVCMEGCACASDVQCGGVAVGGANGPPEGAPRTNSQALKHR
ncbi:GNAT family N-acetyltransferase [Subtercola boreus]|uniref:GNAT family N-acetyltransferase n=1 Tax=Subtercola boreus TaxID=120213 RepID=UPI00345E9CAF